MLISPLIGDTKQGDKERLLDSLRAVRDSRKTRIPVVNNSVVSYVDKPQNDSTYQDLFPGSKDDILYCCPNQLM